MCKCRSRSDECPSCKARPVPDNIARCVRAFSKRAGVSAPASLLVARPGSSPPAVEGALVRLRSLWAV